MSNQSSLGLISPISPTSPVLDWVTITFLTMDWNCNGYISYPKPIRQSSFCNCFRQIAFIPNFRHFEVQISCAGQFEQKFVLNSQFLMAKNTLWLNPIKASFVCSNKEQTLWKFLHFIYLKLTIKMHFGLVDWWTDQSKKKFQKWTGGLVTSTFLELDCGLVLVPFEMYWCTRCIESISTFTRGIWRLLNSFNNWGFVIIYNYFPSYLKLCWDQCKQMSNNLSVSWKIPTSRFRKVLKGDFTKESEISPWMQGNFFFVKSIIYLLTSLVLKFAFT